MVVQHNLTAMNSNRMLGITTGQQAKSSEKLSSGYRINRAADDAAGLTISEKMRKQMRGLDRASTNAQDGVSAVQTAEGALTEVHDMLQRMNELAVQSANGTNSESDRKAIQDEIDQLTTEIDRVAETTKFNEIYMLKGDEGTKNVKMEAHDAGLKGKLVDNGDGTATFTMDELKAGDTVSIGGKNYKIIADADQTPAEEGKDYTTTGATKAKTTLDLSGWTGTDAFTIGGTTYDAGTHATGADVQAAVQADLGEDWVVSFDAVSNELSIEAKEAGEKEAIALANVSVTGGATAATETTNGTAPTAVTKEKDLYAAGGTEALKDDEILDAIKNGKDLYTTPGSGSVAQAQEVKPEDYKTTGATKAKTTLDLSGWTGTDAFTIGGTTYDAGTHATGADVQAAVQADLGEDWVVSFDTVSNELSIEAKEAGEKEAIALANVSVTGGATAATETTNGTAPTAVSVDKPVYAKGGDKALTADDILKAYQNNEKLYYDKQEKADNEITAKKAYELAKAALQQANEIGDTNKTANVTYAAAESEEEAEKTEADYEVGKEYEIGGKKYTIGDTVDNAKTTVTDAINGNTVSAPANAATNMTAVGSVSDGTTTIYMYKKSDSSLYYTTTATLAENETNVTTTDAANVKAATDVDALFAAGATVTFTPAKAGDTDAAVAIADDATDGSTVISAAKAAELANAPAPEGEDEGEPTNVFNITTASAEVAKTLSFNLHVGADADLTNKIQVDIDTMNSTFLGIKGIDVVGKGNDGGMAATYAIDAIADAIAKVSSQRSALGAIQNRLEHTIANVDNVVENTTAAESRIRDTDMAEEMVEYSKNNILAQAGQSMLAQANQSNQGVLSLLG